MGLFNIKKAISNLFAQTTSESDLSPAEKALLSQISKINARGDDITPELYQQLRDFEMNWLERHYDFNSLGGINGIPVMKDLPGAPSPNSSIKSHTGEVYYYLRHKAYAYEDLGHTELALACMRKSVALVKCRSFYAADDWAPLVKMLARTGYIEEACQENNLLNQIFPNQAVSHNTLEAEIRRGNEARDFLWLQSNIPDKCPKSISSFRRMKTQNTKNYQILKQLAANLGREI